MKIDNNMSQSDRCELFGCLIDTVEDWLESKGITVKDIPNPEREDEASAIIYGSDYDDLANEFANILGIDRDAPEQRKEPELLTAGLLRELMGDKNIPELSHFLEGRKDDEILDLLNSYDYFAMKIWSEEDISNVISECGYEVNEENIAAVIHSGKLESLEDCTEDEWNILKNAVQSVLEKEENLIEESER